MKLWNAAWQRHVSGCKLSAGILYWSCPLNLQVTTLKFHRSEPSESTPRWDIYRVCTGIWMHPPESTETSISSKKLVHSSPLFHACFDVNYTDCRYLWVYRNKGTQEGTAVWLKKRGDRGGDGWLQTWLQSFCSNVFWRHWSKECQISFSSCCLFFSVLLSVRHTHKHTHLSGASHTQGPSTPITLAWGTMSF